VISDVVTSVKWAAPPVALHMLLAGRRDRSAAADTLHLD
jgi:hypothetical protein